MEVKPWAGHDNLLRLKSLAAAEGEANANSHARDSTGSRCRSKDLQARCHTRVLPPRARRLFRRHARRDGRNDVRRHLELGLTIGDAAAARDPSEIRVHGPNIALLVLDYK